MMRAGVFVVLCLSTCVVSRREDIMREAGHMHNNGMYVFNSTFRAYNKTSMIDYSFQFPTNTYNPDMTLMIFRLADFEADQTLAKGMGYQDALNKSVWHYDILVHAPGSNCDTDRPVTCNDVIDMYLPTKDRYRCAIGNMDGTAIWITRYKIWMYLELEERKFQRDYGELAFGVVMFVMFGATILAIMFGLLLELLRKYTRKSHQEEVFTDDISLTEYNVMDTEPGMTI
ncbi:uncharacterized protein LOC124265415 isoform X4 [Haliotis rubra]|uniref:uncharacterized protein LOC124265415 isoform X2 n=1 Tax=Haliotis rubra TaxID=36100 RepID=UPI001EE59444|nr:uncharacterized protein LOC124265415 isoform X2 [Haliotis rubra]XP_046556164.1 uncharacterized protein LOC124265415 isoform X4 [Haliotis rubra]